MPGTAAGGEVEAARELIEQAVDSTSGDAHATVIIGDATYEFRPLEPGPDDDFYSFCTTVAGSLQGTMQLVDGTGAHVADGEISFVFLEPGGAYASTGDPPELLFTLPADDQPIARSYVAVATTVRSPASRAPTR